MTLDRDAIVRSDFPAARRGLDPDAVRAHLEAVADEVDALRAAAARVAPPSAASAASERVGTIVAAAEESAAEIERSAREEADRVRADAARESRELVDDVRAAAADLHARVAALDDGLAALVERVGVVASEPLEPPEPPPEPDRASLAGPDTAPVEASREEAAVAPPEAVAAPDQPAPRATPNGSANDADGARLVALNMALSGASREEADRYVAEHFDVPDRSALLDDVFASVDD